MTARIRPCIYCRTGKKRFSRAECYIFFCFGTYIHKKTEAPSHGHLWGGMLLTGIIYGAFAGTMPEITDAVISSSKEAITLCITMAGVMAVWVGLWKSPKTAA